MHHLWNICRGRASHTVAQQDVETGRRPKKSAAFRRSCSASDHIVVRNLTSSMLLKDGPDKHRADVPYNQERDVIPDAEEVDDKGMPTIFTKFALTFDFLHDSVASDVASMTRQSSARSLGTSIADTLLYDSDGIPIMVGEGSSHLDKAYADTAPCTVEEVSTPKKFTPMDPIPRRRKAAILARRITTPPSKPKASPKSVAKKTKVSAEPKTSKPKAVPSDGKAKAKLSGLGIVLIEPKLALTTEANPRAELTAKGMVDDVKTRIFVCTATRNGWGPKFHGDMCIIRDMINNGEVTKEMCLKVRDELHTKAKASIVD